MSSHDSRIFPYPFDNVFKEAQNALIDCRFRIKYADYKSGTIHCSLSENFRAWFGETLEIYLTKVENGVQIVIKSAAKGPMPTTFGKSDENIDDFFLFLSRRLQQTDARPAPPPPPAEIEKTLPPPPPSPKCPECKKKVRYVPEYSKWYCDKCKKYTEI